MGFTRKFLYFFTGGLVRWRSKAEIEARNLQELLDDELLAARKRCPECAELVRAEALKCRYCQYRFDSR